MKKTLTLTLSLCALLAFPVWAKPVKTEEQAVKLVQHSVKKNKLTKLPVNCLDFKVKQTLPADYPNYDIDVYQKAAEPCGGKQKYLFGYVVNKKQGWLKTNAIEQPCYRNEIKGKPYACLEKGYYVAIDPVSPIIVYDNPKPLKTRKNPH